MKRGIKSKKNISTNKTKKVSKNKKISKTKVSKKKTLTNKQWLTISIAAFLVFAIALAFVNVPQNASVTGEYVGNISTEGINSRVGNFLTDFIDFDTGDTIVIKYAFFVLLTIFIVSILSMADFPNKPFLRFLLALPVSYISIILIKPEEILSATILYSSLGMTFIVMIPLVIMALFTSQVLQGKLTAGKIILQLMVWYFYLAFLIYFLIRAFTDTKNLYSGGVLAVIIIGIIISLIIIIFNKKIRLWIRNKGREAREETLKDLEDLKRVHEMSEAERMRERIKAAEELHTKK